MEGLGLCSNDCSSDSVDTPVTTPPEVWMLVVIIVPLLKMIESDG